MGALRRSYKQATVSEPAAVAVRANLGGDLVAGGRRIQNTARLLNPSGSTCSSRKASDENRLVWGGAPLAKTHAAWARRRRKRNSPLAVHRSARGLGGGDAAS